MGKINLLIANANEYFSSAEGDSIRDAAASAEKFINDHFKFDYSVDIIITAPSFLMKTIPEDGISGRAYNSRLIIIVLDKEQATITRGTVYETICHEMSHSLRWEKLSEYSDNLFKGMILEGLATALEEKALKEDGSDTLQFYLKTIRDTTEIEYVAMIDALKDSFENKSYDYETIFYTGNDTLPRWAGYRLGYYYVKQYIERTGRSIEEATLDSYDLFTYK